MSGLPDPLADPLAAPLADRPEVWPVLDSEDLHRDDWVLALRRDTVPAPSRPDEPFHRVAWSTRGR